MAFVTPVPVQIGSTTTVRLGYEATLNAWASANGKETMEQRTRGQDAISLFPYTIPVVPGAPLEVVSSKVVMAAPKYLPSAG